MDIDYKKLDKKARTYMYVTSFIKTVIAALTLITIYFFIRKNFEIPILFLVGFIALLLINAVIGPMVRYHRYAYILNEEYIDVRKGYLFVERQIVPIERIHNIEINNGPISRIFSLSDVKVTTAGSTISISYLEEEKAEEIVQVLQKRINIIARDKKERIQQSNQPMKEDSDGV